MYTGTQGMEGGIVTALLTRLLSFLTTYVNELLTHFYLFSATSKFVRD